MSAQLNLLDLLDLLRRLHKLLVPHVAKCHSLAQLFFALVFFQQTHSIDENGQIEKGHNPIPGPLLEQVVTYFGCALCNVPKSDGLSALKRIVTDDPESWPKKTAKLLDRRARNHLSAHPQLPQEILPASFYRAQSEIPEPIYPAHVPDSPNDILHDCITRRIQCVCQSSPAHRNHTGCLQLKRCERLNFEDKRLNVEDENHIYDLVFAHFYHPKTEKPHWRRLRFHVNGRVTKDERQNHQSSDLTLTQSASVGSSTGKSIGSSYNIATPLCELLGHEDDYKKRVDALCNLLRNDDGPVYVNLKADSEQLTVMGPPDGSTYSLLRQEAVSLEFLLQRYSLTDEGKMHLAHCLSWAVWQYYNSKWMCNRWTANEVHFIPPDVDDIAGFPRGSLDAMSPHVKMELSGEKSEFDPLQSEYYTESRSQLIHPAPRIHALGVMLANIFGHTIKKDDIASIKLYNTQQIHYSGTLPEDWPRLDAKSSKLQARIKEATLACFNHTYLKKADLDRAARRKYLYEKIVWPLRYLAVEAYPATAEAFWSPMAIGRAHIMADNNESTTTGHRPGIAQSTSPDRLGTMSSLPVKPGSSVGTWNGTTASGVLQTSNVDGDVHDTGTLRTKSKARGADSPGVLAASATFAIKSDTDHSSVWLNKLDLLHATMQASKSPSGGTHCPVKIAVLDTGLGNHQNYGDVKYRDFVDPKNTCRIDKTLHGTQTVDLILKAYPEADLYVGRVFDQNYTDEITGPSLLAKAIRWAAKKGVDIITISGGFRTEHPQLRKEIKFAHERKKEILIFAAAGNWGNTGPVAFPAAIRDHVFCIYSCTGDLWASRMNPPARTDAENFASLGEGVKLCGHKEPLDGTSVATPLAAGLAARLLDFVRHVDSRDAGCDEQKLHTRPGMRSVFKRISHQDGLFQCLAPERLWQRPSRPSDEQLCRERIQEVIREALDTLDR